MTIYRVDSAGSNTSPYNTWAKAATAIQTAMTAAAAGDDIWVAAGSSPHNETLASGNQTLTCSAATVASQVTILSIDPADDSYDPVTTAQITSGVSTDDLTISGKLLIVGIGISCGTLYTESTQYKTQYYLDCYIESTEVIRQGNNANEITFENCTLKSTGATISSNGFIQNYRCKLVLKGCTFPAPTDTSPGCLFSSSGIGGASTKVVDSDMSAWSNFTFGLIYFGANDYGVTYVLENNTIASGEPITNTIVSPVEVTLYNTGAANTIVDYFYANYFGSVADSTSIYLSGSDGVTSYSFVMDPSGNGLKEQIQPLRFMLGSVQLDASASETVKVNITYDNATALQDDELWIEVEYADDTTNQGLIATTAPGIQVTPSNLTTNSESWTGTSGFTNGVTAHCITSAISDGKACMARVYVCLAKDQTVYVCPEVVVA